MNAKWIVKITVTASLWALVFPAQAGNAESALDAKATEIIKRDFHDKGIAKVERLNQDAVQEMCSKFINSPPIDDEERLESEQEKIIAWPADGKFTGNWKDGEVLAQSGAGMTWSDNPKATVGGNCYNCHQLSAKEIAYGTIGPSLLHFRDHHIKTSAGKIRSEEELQRYVYGRIYNNKAFNICSEMPRFGHMGVLTETQIKNLVSLLLDPESPVNK